MNLAQYQELLVHKVAIKFSFKYTYCREMYENSEPVMVVGLVLAAVCAAHGR